MGIKNTNKSGIGSRILFTGSQMAVHPHVIVLSYGVTKSAVCALAKNLVKQLFV